MKIEQGIPQQVLHSPIQPLDEIAKGWSYKVVPDEHFSIEFGTQMISNLTEGDGKKALEINLSMRQGFMHKINAIRNGDVIQGSVEPSTFYVEDEKDPTKVVPTAYVRPIQYYVDWMVAADTEAYAVAQNINEPDLYKPLDKSDWPADYWEFESSAYIKLALGSDSEEERAELLAASRVCNTKAEDIRFAEKQLKVLPIEKLAREEVAPERIRTSDVWSEIQKQIATQILYKRLVEDMWHKYVKPEFIKGDPQNSMTEPIAIEQIYTRDYCIIQYERDPKTNESLSFVLPAYKGGENWDFVILPDGKIRILDQKGEELQISTDRYRGNVSYDVFREGKKSPVFVTKREKSDMWDDNYATNFGDKQPVIEIQPDEQSLADILQAIQDPKHDVQVSEEDIDKVVTYTDKKDGEYKGQRRYMKIDLYKNTPPQLTNELYARLAKQEEIFGK